MHEMILFYVFIHHASWRANIDKHGARKRVGRAIFLPPSSDALHDTQPNMGIDSYCSDARLGCVHIIHSAERPRWRLPPPRQPEP